MNAVIERFLERPTSHKVAFWLGSLALLGYLFWQLIYADLATENERLDGEVSRLQSEISVERRLSRDLPKLRKEVEQLDIKMKKAMMQLPDKKEIPELLSSVSNLARESGLEVSLFRPNPERTKDFYAEVPVSVSVEGTFHQIATFFDEVGRLPRIVNIDQIQVHDPKIGEDRIAVKTDCNVTTFRFLEESERLQNEDESDAKRRKRSS